MIIKGNILKWSRMEKFWNGQECGKCQMLQYGFFFGMFQNEKKFMNCPYS